MASLIYTTYTAELLNGKNIDLDTDTIKVALVTSSYVPNQSTDDFFNDITNEVTGTGYSAGGNTLTSATVTQDNANKRSIFSGATVTWPASSITARGAILYKSTGVSSTSPLIAYIDFGSDLVTVGATFTVAWNSTGILTLTIV